MAGLSVRTRDVRVVGRLAAGPNKYRRTAMDVGVVDCADSCVLAGREVAVVFWSGC